MVHIIYLRDRTKAERLEGTTYSSLEELKRTLANDGVDYIGIQPLYEFTTDWNDNDNDDTPSDLFFALMELFITYVTIIE